MNEQRLRIAWQRAARNGSGVPQAADVFAEGDEARGAALDAVSTDPVAVALVRSGLSLQADADVLSRAVAAQRTQRRSAFGARRMVGWAVAASVIAAAVLVMPKPDQPVLQAPIAGDTPALTPTGLIVSGSFESTGDDTRPTAPATKPAQVFAGGFDS